MVSTEYARDTIVTNTTPIAAINASSSRCNHTRGLTENEYSQYRPLHANNPTALTTSFERGLEPTCRNTYSALAGFPRCVADATSPTMVTTRGMHINVLMRTRIADSNFESSSTAATKTRATAPEGASVVNSTNVTSPNAVSNPEIISSPSLQHRSMRNAHNTRMVRRVSLQQRAGPNDSLVF